MSSNTITTFKVGFFSTKSYDKHFFSAKRHEALTGDNGTTPVTPVSSSSSFVADNIRSIIRSNNDNNNNNNGVDLEILFFDTQLNENSAPLARDCDAICVFVNDSVSAAVLDRITQAVGAGGGGDHEKQQQQQQKSKLKMIALRSAGYNHVDLKRAQECGVQVVTRVPAYSPHSVAEHAVALILALNRKIHKAYNRVREGDFHISGLLGFDLHGKTVGVLGTGKIGAIFARIMKCGFGCNVIAFDPYPNSEVRDELQIPYVATKEELFARSDIISLHCPLFSSTYHVINAAAIRCMKKGVMIINTSRGGLVDTKSVIHGLKERHIGYLGIDVYENESDYFYEDRTEEGISDEMLARLMTFNNVLVTSHQAFFTDEAMCNISESVVDSLSRFARGEEIPKERVVPFDV